MSSDAYGPEIEGGFRSDGEISAGTTRSKYPVFHRVASGHVVGMRPDGRGGFVVHAGGPPVDLSQAPKRVGAEFSQLPLDPRNHPQVRAGAPFVPLGYDPTSQRASGTTKALPTYLQLRSLIGATGRVPQGVAELMYFWAQQGVAPPPWLDGLVAGSAEAVFLIHYAARLRQIVGA